MNEEKTDIEDGEIITVEQTDSDNQHNTSPSIIKKYSKFGLLGLLLSIIAIAISAYSVYFYHLTAQNNIPNESDKLTKMQSNLANTDKKLEQRISDLQTELANISSQLQTSQQAQDALDKKLQTLQEKPTKPPVHNDNPTNQNPVNSITKIPDSLLEDIASQKSMLATLELDLKTLQANVTAQSASGLNTQVSDTQTTDDGLQRQQIKHLLSISDLYLKNGNKEIAVQTLQKIERFEGLTVGFYNVLQEHIQNLQSIPEINLSLISTQIQKIKNTAVKFKLNIKQTGSDAKSESWYSKLVSVKKIDDSSRIKSSAFLHVIKTQINQSLLLAEIAAYSKNQVQWQKQLNKTKSLLELHFPQKTSAMNIIQSLLNTQVFKELPNNEKLFEALGET
ncbi:MAG: hypothetical protein L3J52_01010 [Proteobacteria bacterium]|nr:hypothetical protein [Pseudomonadota bacterium]